ncbi:helix-turn-helix domain-containing protein [Micromonospora halotolerans]|uniref:Helix-turn-helix domain-containing protein n=1 Tax=Micromonospora halotolerans TaxID=709879 RepID=A0ABY9ZRL2_9ACTN|nr:helix-turn-helix domain-containing protein [Micromonospora halotolerans]WNM37542.1 helix-turn-helix domain-containing protein [Micromonospora halotolerans]
MDAVPAGADNGVPPKEVTVILAVASVDTAGLPPAERFDFWQDVVARESVAARISSAHAADFAASARAVDLGVVRLGAWRYPSLELARTPRLIRSSDPELYQLALPLNGHGVVSQQRRSGRLGPSGFALIDTVRPHGSRHAPDRTAAPLETLTVLVPHRALPLPPHRAAALLAAPIPADAGMGALLAGFLRRLVAHPEQYAAADAPRLDRIALDLIAGTLAGQVEAERDLPVEVRITGLRARVEAWIREHLADPGLTPAAAAEAHHLSVRALHRLFEGGDTSVAALIRTARLDRCFRDLADPRLRHLAVHQVAARWGFRDRAHFSRAFRAAYGLSPREHRARSIRT